MEHVINRFDALKCEVIYGDWYYLEISELGRVFQQGPLATRISLDLQALGRDGNIISANNIFQEAFREALNEVTCEATS